MFFRELRLDLRVQAGSSSFEPAFGRMTRAVARAIFREAAGWPSLPMNASALRSAAWKFTSMMSPLRISAARLAAFFQQAALYQASSLLKPFTASASSDFHERVTTKRILATSCSALGSASAPARAIRVCSLLLLLGTKLVAIVLLLGNLGVADLSLLKHHIAVRQLVFVILALVGHFVNRLDIIYSTLSNKKPKL